MKQKIISLCAATIMAIVQSYGGVTLTMPDVSIAPGGTSYVVIQFDLGTPAYTAYQFDITYPNGISSVISDDGNPELIKGDVYNDAHNVSSVITSNGLNRFQCFSVNSVPLTEQSGTLLILPIKAKNSMVEGTYQATISPIEFVQTDATPDRPNAMTFNIRVSKHVVLDEMSTIPPVSANAVDAIVKRSIMANQWSTIVLPFAMSEAQLKKVFGDDVMLANFIGYKTTEDINKNIVGLIVNFTKATEIEANHPYIIKVSTAISEFNIDGVDVDPQEAPTNAVVKRTKRQWSEMIGTYKAGTEVPEKTLFLNNNKFYYSMGKTTMKGYRAYFDFYDVLTDVEDVLSESNIRFFVDEEPAIIEGIGESSVLQGAVYNVNGQLVGKDIDVKTLPRGIYYVDSKKVAIY